MTTFNEFQRELRKRINDPQVAYMLSMLFEKMTALSAQVDDCASVLLNVVNQNERVASLNANTMQRVQRIERKGMPEGVEVTSVSPDPEP